MKKKIILAIILTLIISCVVVMIAWFIGNNLLKKNTLYTEVVDNINDKDKTDLLKGLTDMFVLDPNDDGFSYNLYKNKVIIDTRYEYMLLNYIRNNNNFVKNEDTCLTGYVTKSNYDKEYSIYFEGSPSEKSIENFIYQDNRYYYDKCNKVENTRTIMKFNYKYDFDGTYYYVYQAAGYYVENKGKYDIYGDFNSVQIKSEELNISSQMINIGNYNTYSNYKLKFIYENNKMKLIGIEEV